MKQKVAVIDGYRTPFIKAGTDFKNLTSLDLAKAATSELINRTELDPQEINEVIMGTVFPPVYYPNIAREIVIGLGLPSSITGFTLTRACASSAQAVISGTEGILLGNYDVVIAGGSESLSQLQIIYPQEFVSSIHSFSKAKTIKDKMNILSKINIKDLIPTMPNITELSTGYSMGQHADMMARQNGISREEQDQFAFDSHRKAAKAIEENIISKEIITTYAVPDYKPVKEDNNIRKEPDLNSMKKLKPVFDKKYGTVTAANASPLTDGGSATLIMSDKKAKALGYKPKAYIKAYAYGALDPQDQLLLGNAYSIPKVLEKAKLSLKDIGLVEMHEAFAVQVLSSVKALASKKFAKEKLGQNKAIGEINPDILNIYGGSVAIGHPFGATGTRIINTMANELQRGNNKYGLLAICAAGAMSVAMILEKAD